MPYQPGFKGKPRIPLTRTFTQFTNLSTSLTTHTFSGVSFSTAQADRYIVAAIHDFEGVQTACTIGGIAATKLFGNTTGSFPVTWWMAHVPTGASGNVVLTTSVNRTAMPAAFYAVYGSPKLTPFDTASTGQVSSANNSVSIDAAQGGLILAGAGMSSTGSPSFAWSVVTEDHDTALSAQVALSDASATFANAQAGVTVGYTLSGNPTLAGTLQAISLEPQ